MKTETQAYLDMHKAKLLEMKEEAIQSVWCKQALRKMVYDCPCGARVGCKQLQFHFISMKHRKVCGDLPAPEHLSTHLESSSSSPPSSLI
nr:MAG: hypothetical protein [Lake Baikal virophage 4]